MQIIQPLLGTKAPPLGARAPLCEPNRLLLKKESNLLDGQNGLIRKIATRSPLVNYSKILLSKRPKPFLEPLIESDTWENHNFDAESASIEFEIHSSLEKHSNFDNTDEEIKGSTPDILPKTINSNINNENERNIQEISKFKQNKSQAKSKTKSPSTKSTKSLSPAKSKTQSLSKSQHQSQSKSTNKQSVKSPANNKVEQLFDESNTHINLAQDGLLTADKAFRAESEIHTFNDNSPSLQHHRDLGSTTSDSDVARETIAAVPTLPNEEQPILVSNLANDEGQVIPLSSTLPSGELLTTVNNPQVSESVERWPHDITFDNTTSEAKSASIVPMPPNIGETLPLQPHATPHLALSRRDGVYNGGDFPTGVAPQQEDKGSMADILPSRIDSHTSSEIELELNIQEKPKSKEQNKTQAKLKSKSKSKSSKSPSQAKSKTKSPSKTRNKQSVKLPANNKVEQLFDESNIRINLNEDRLLTADEPFDAESQIHIFNDNSPSVQQHRDSASSTTSDSDSVASTPIPVVPTLPNLEEQPILVSNLANDEEQLIPSPSTLPNAELLTTVHDPQVSESIVRSPHDDITFDNTTPDHQSTLPPQSPQHNTGSPTSQIPQGKEPQTSSPPLQAARESHTGGIETSIAKANAPDLISSSTRSDAVFDDAMLPQGENALLLSVPSSPSIEDTPTLPQNNINSNLTPTESRESILNLAPLTSPATSEDTSTLPQNNINSNLTPTESRESILNLAPLTSPATSEDTPTLPQNNINPNLTPNESRESILNLAPLTSPATSEDTPTLPQNNINPNLTPNESRESIPNLAPLTSPATSDVIAAEVAKSTQPQPGSNPEASPYTASSTETQLLSTPTSKIVEESNSEVLKNTAFPSAATTPNIAETPNVSSLVNNEQQVVSDIPFGVINTGSTTKINTSNTLESPTPAQNNENSSPREAGTKIDLDKPAPQGFATGGHVTTTYVNTNQPIAPSDTVPAMLTPGEFVINARDAQKNLNLLQHINTGGTANDTILTRSETSNPKEQKETTSVESPTKVDSLQDTSLQPKNSDNISSQVSNSLISSSLGLSIGKERRSILSSPELNTNVSKTTNVGEPSHYSSPSLIFRQKNPPSTDTPSQWSSVEELLNASGDVTDFNFGSVKSNRHSEFSQFTSHASKVPSESPKVFAKHLEPKGFADGGEVNTDINTNIQPITETIQRPSSSSKKDDDANLEVLAREIYSRLRQRLEIERERYGVYSGRLPW
ncbi:MAG: hypothetical protein KME57_19180 [Scytonema hyalinum WJT4-NPBG1]|jgi:hypothetical protein|nr:hypothetical protein [Scytonema hyalinum WJT4-NPBG1]